MFLKVIVMETALCPRIKCFWGFQCAFCWDDSRYKYPVCERHIHKWDTLNIGTKRQVYSYVNAFNTNSPETNRRKLQIFIHRIEILDELNKLKSFYNHQDE
jgi:hypothetical protein